MANYVGVDCPVCASTFTDDDDIVVCPICGTPHHRTCYQKVGTCVNKDQHDQSFSWVRQTVSEPASSPEDAGEIKVGKCPSCGEQNPADSMFCSSCGMRFGGATSSAFHAASQAYMTAFGGVSPNEVISGVSARDLALYVGNGSHYYLPRFREIAKGSTISFNFSAFLNFLFFFYRKMYRPGLLLLALYAILQIPSVVYAYEFMGYFAQHMSDFMTNMDFSILATFTPTRFTWTIPLMNISQYILFTSSVLLMLFSNKIYLNCALRDIKKIKARCTNSPEGFDEAVYSEMLSRRGRPGFGLVVLVILGIFVISSIISLIITLPYLPQIPS